MASLAGYGDSMTMVSHPGWLSGMVGGAYTVTDAGVNNEFGATQGWNRLAADAPGLTQNYVVAMWGTNDLGLGWSLSEELWTTNLYGPYTQQCAAAVAAVQARGIPLVLMVPPPFGTHPGQTIDENALTTARRGQLREFILRTFPTLPIIDLSGIAAATYIAADNVHFSAAGNTYVAGLVTEMLGLLAAGPVAESGSAGSGGAWPVTQDGYVTWDGVWDGTSTAITLPGDGSRLGGLVFSGFPVNTVTRIRPPSPIYTSTQTYLSTQIQVTSTSNVAGTLTVRLTPDVVPPVFWTGYPPPAVGTVVATFPVSATPGAQVVPLDLGPMTLRYRRSQWQGAWAFSLQWTGPGDLVLATRQNPSVAGPVMLTESVSEMSGIQGHVKAQSRVDRCPRCSRPSIREEWVTDGYSKTFVCKDCWDPADPLWYRRVPRPVRPGINDAG